MSSLAKTNPVIGCQNCTRLLTQEQPTRGEIFTERVTGCNTST